VLKHEPPKQSLPEDTKKKIEKVPISKPVAKKRAHSSSTPNFAPPSKVLKPNHPPKIPMDVSRPPVPTAYVVRPHSSVPQQAIYSSQTTSLPNTPVSVSGTKLVSSTPTSAPLTQHIRHLSPQVPPAVSSAPQQPPLPSKVPVIDLMAPNASLLVLIRNSGKYQFDDSTVSSNTIFNSIMLLPGSVNLILLCLTKAD